jgi:D-arginine utilization repressor
MGRSRAPLSLSGPPRLAITDYTGQIGPRNPDMEAAVPAVPARRPPSPSMRRLRAAAVPIADGIAALLYPFAETVVHDLRSQVIVHIANNLSRRSVGDATALEDLELTPGESVIGPYEKKNWDGGRMRAVSIVVRDERDTPIGLVCVNLAIDRFDQARAVLDLFTAGVRTAPQPERLFRDDWQEKILSFLHPWLEARQLTLGALSRSQKREAVLALEAQGAFRGRSAAGHVAKLLGMGRATIFQHLRSARLQTAGAA